MAIPCSGTFDYVAVVPGDYPEHPAPWNVQLRMPIEATGDPLFDDRLVGHSPILEIVDAGITPDQRVSEFTETVRPRVLRSRITLKASGGRVVAFHVARALIGALQPRDMLFMTGTGCGGRALSILRDGQLVAAAGAVTRVPLGDFVARIPVDLIQEAEDVFRRRDPEFEFFHELPVEIGDHTNRHYAYRGWHRFGSYEVFVDHGPYPDVPGKDECVGISLVGTCPDGAAVASAQLMDFPDALEISSL